MNVLVIHSQVSTCHSQVSLYIIFYIPTRDAINEEMKKIKEMEAFKIYNGKPEDLFGYKQISTHMIFDIKLGENFRRKARLVADGHKTDPPSSVTYSSVVSRDSVRICLPIAALNDLDLQAAEMLIFLRNVEKKIVLLQVTSLET